MVRSIVIALLLACCAAVSAAELTLTLDSPEIERGRVFIGQLDYHGKSGDGPADLRPWEKRFLIERSNFSQEKTADGVRSSEDIRLYPRFSGEGVIDAIAHGGVIMEPIPVTVRPLQRNGIDGEPILTPLPAQAQVGVPVTIGVTVPLLSPGNKVSAGPWEADGFIVQPLPQRQIDIAGQAAVQLRWLLYPQIKGDHQLDLPTIQQRGHGRWRYHLPLQTLRVMPLPSYLPPTLPIGAIRVASRSLDINGQPHWQLTVSSRGMIDDHPWGLHDAITRATGIDEDAITMLDETVDADGTRHKRWRFPVPRWTLPWLSRPTLELRWYDPDAGRVQTVNHRLARAENIPTWFGLLLLAATLTAAIALAGLLGRILRRLRTWWRYQQQLRAAPDPHSLRRALLDHGGHRHLEAWAATRNSICATQAAAELNALCFRQGSHRDGLAEVKKKVRYVESAGQRLQQLTTRRLQKIVKLLRGIRDRIS